MSLHFTSIIPLFLHLSLHLLSHPICITPHFLLFSFPATQVETHSRRHGHHESPHTCDFSQSFVMALINNWSRGSSDCSKSARNMWRQPFSLSPRKRGAPPGRAPQPRPSHPTQTASTITEEHLCVSDISWSSRTCQVTYIQEHDSRPR